MISILNSNHTSSLLTLRPYDNKAFRRVNHLILSVRVSNCSDLGFDHLFESSL